jgi:hypothetical protein
VWLAQKKGPLLLPHGTDDPGSLGIYQVGTDFPGKSAGEWIGKMIFFYVFFFFFLSLEVPYWKPKLLLGMFYTVLLIVQSILIMFFSIPKMGC